MNIYIGNISHSSTEEGLKQLFEQFGSVSSAKIIKDKFTDNSRGFAFVEMADAEEAKRAIENLNGVEFDGRTIRVNEARPVEQRDSRGGHTGGPRRSGGFGGPRGGGDRDRNRRF
jgi:cold-inducible RNA-binding protein